MVYNVQYSQIKMSRQNFTIYNTDSLKIIYKKSECSVGHRSVTRPWAARELDFSRLHAGHA